MNRIRKNRSMQHFKFKMLLPIIMVLLLQFQTSCSKNSKCHYQLSSPCPWCEVENPIEELPWLRNLIVNNCDNFPCGLRVYTCSLLDDTPAILLNTSPRCTDGYWSLRNCKGEQIGVQGGIAGETEGEFKVDWNSLNLIYEQ